MAFSPRTPYVYHDENGDTWTVRLAATTATLGGFSAGRGAKGKWPYPIRHCRHINGSTNDETRKHTFPCAQSTYNGLASGGSFSFDGSTFICTGRSGERVTFG